MEPAWRQSLQELTTAVEAEPPIGQSQAEPGIEDAEEKLSEIQQDRKVGSIGAHTSPPSRRQNIFAWIFLLSFAAMLISDCFRNLSITIRNLWIVFRPLLMGGQS